MDWRGVLERVAKRSAPIAVAVPTEKAGAGAVAEAKDMSLAFERGSIELELALRLHRREMMSTCSRVAASGGSRAVSDCSARRYRPALPSSKFLWQPSARGRPRPFRLSPLVER